MSSVTATRARTRNGHCNGRFSLPIGNPDVPVDAEDRPVQAPKPSEDWTWDTRVRVTDPDDDWGPDTRIGLAPTGPDPEVALALGRHVSVVIERAGLPVRVVPGLTADEAAYYVREFNRLNGHNGLWARLHDRLNGLPNPDGKLHGSRRASGKSGLAVHLLKAGFSIKETAAQTGVCRATLVKIRTGLAAAGRIFKKPS